MKKVKAFTVSTPLTIIALVVLICVGAYLAYAISVTNKTDNLGSTITTESTNKISDADVVEQSDTSNVAESVENINKTNDVSQSDQSTETANTASQTTPAEVTNTSGTEEYTNIHTNKTYGFSFKYPSNWVVRDMTSSNTHVQELLGLYTVAPKSVAEDNFYSVKVTSRSLEDELIDARGVDGITVTIDEAVTKYGKSGWQITAKNSSTVDSSTTYYFELSDGNILSVTGETTSPSISSKIANEIVETFEFTK